MIKTVLFDLDGTITDPKVGITKSVAYALAKFDILVENLDDLTPFIGPPLVDSFMEFYHLSEADANKAILYYREYFSVDGLFENIPYPYVEPMLQWLNDHHITCIIATSKPEQFAKKIMEHFHLSNYFAGVCGATFDCERNKKGDVIAYAMKKHNLSNDTTIMVGDRKHDVIGAIENEIPCIGVLYGYGSFEELKIAGATSIVTTMEELRNCIQLYEK